MLGTSHYGTPERFGLTRKPYATPFGPAGTDEWQAFIRDSEGNLVGLVEQRQRS